MQDNISHFSATISPAPKNLVRNEIESLYETLIYYRNNDISEVIVQPKHMGSYCAIYLYENLEDTKFFSRGGYLIRERNNLTREDLLSAVQNLHEKLIIEKKNKQAVVEAELMSWSVLGKGLIEREFDNYYRLHKEHCSYLKNSAIAEKLDRIITSIPYQSYKTHGTDKSHIKRQYEALETLRYGCLPDVNVYEKDIERYKVQLDRYAASKEIYFEPFNVVYYVTDTDEKVLNNDNLIYNEINKNTCLSLNLKNFESSEQFAYEFFNKFKDLEGVVVKPRYSRKVGIAHALKVRTNDYLQLIYGINFHKDYDYYLNKRNIRRKLQISIEEYELHVKLSESNDSDEKRKLYYKALDAEKYEETLDSRL